MIDPSFAAISPEWKWIGVLALVGVVLVMVLWKSLTLTIDRFDQVDIRHTKSLDRIVEDHRQERTEWRESNEKSHGEVKHVIEELSNAIREAGGQNHA